jgi:hypothetical protein
MCASSAASLRQREMREANEKATEFKRDGTTRRVTPVGAARYSSQHCRACSMNIVQQPRVWLVLMRERFGHTVRCRYIEAQMRRVQARYGGCYLNNNQARPTATKLNATTAAAACVAIAIQLYIAQVRIAVAQWLQRCGSRYP